MAGEGTWRRRRSGERRARFGAIGAAAAVAAIAGAGLEPPALGADGFRRADFALKFAQQRPGAATPMHLRIVYRAADDPEGKPSPIRRVVLEVPEGTQLRGAELPACTASDEQFRLVGRSACPADTKIGSGHLKAITGFGGPTDPFGTDVTIYNVPGGFAELVQQKDSNTTLAIDRAVVEGNRITLTPPATPGGPPDGETAVRRIVFDFSRRYVRTPPGCPSGGQWRSRGTFTFADETTTADGSHSACIDP